MLVHSDGRLVAVGPDAYSERAAAPWGEPPEKLFVAELPAGRLRELIEPLIEVRALTPIARTSQPPARAAVLDGTEKTVVRLVVESPTANGPSGVRRRLRSRVHVLPACAATRRRRSGCGAQLEDDLGLIAADEPLHDEAVAVGGRHARRHPGAARTGAAPGPARRRGRRRACCGACSAPIEDNLPGTLADVDSEFLHDLRVAVRRTRAAAARAARRVPPSRAAALPRGLPLAPERHRAHARPRRLPARLRRFPHASCQAPPADLDAAATACSPTQRKLAPEAHGARAALGQAARPAGGLGRVHRRPRRTGRRTSAPTPRARSASWPAPRIAHRLPAHGQGAAARSATTSPPEALHDLRKTGQGAALPARVLRRRSTRTRPSADGEDAQGAAGHRSGASRTARCRPRCCGPCATRWPGARAAPPR